MESSWGFVSTDAIHLHREETILGHHFLLFKAHSVTESRGKSKDTGYLNYPETVGYFGQTHAHVHPLIFFPGSFSQATSLLRHSSF